MLSAFRNIFKIPDLRKKLMITAAFLVLYRVGTYIPLPGINKTELARNLGEGGGMADVLNQISMLTGGSLGGSP